MSNPFASLEKAIAILTLCESEHRGLSAQEISQKLGMPLSTTYKYLDIFLRNNFLSKDERTKKFFFGMMIFKMGNLAAERISIVNIARPHMIMLSRQCKETVLLTVIHDMEALCVESIESPRMVRLSIRKGATLPLHAGSSQKILLAYQDEYFIDTLIENKGLVRFNENTITDPEKLERELELIRRQGFTESDSEIDPGAGSVAAPIFGFNGSITAGLTVAGPTDRIFGENREMLIDAVTDYAQKISFELGYVKKDTAGALPSP